MRVLVLAAVATLTCVACKDDTPPPPAPSATVATPKDMAPLPVADPAARLGRGATPNISPVTMKDFRVDSCYFGAQGLRQAREAYEESMGADDPSAEHLPSFGEYPENERYKGRRGGARANFAAQQLPFVQFVRACSVVRSLKEPAHEELDSTIGDFATFAGKLNKNLIDANRYYSRKQWENDEFKRGLTLHKDLIDSFPQLDEHLATLDKSVASWHAAHAGSGKEELDEAGKLADTAYAKARALTLALMGERDPEAITAALTAAKEAREALSAAGEKNADSAFPKVVLPGIDEVLAAAETASKIEGTGKLRAAQSYPVTAAMARLAQAKHRALAQHLRSTGDVVQRKTPLRTLNPRLRPGNLPIGGDNRPRVRPPASPDE